MSTPAQGAVFTRQILAEFLLDLAGYTLDAPLPDWRFLEPSAGGGTILLAAIERLLAVWRREPGRDRDPLALADAIRAVEIHPETFEATRTRVVETLRAHGLGSRPARALADRWLVPGDFLLCPLPDAFDVIAGNPPYVRTERQCPARRADYRARYATVYDRADLYVPFFERALRLLAPGATLAFICADRWMKNRYGGPLRALIRQEYHLRLIVDLNALDPFEIPVLAYPALTVITRAAPGPTTLVAGIDPDPAGLAALARHLKTQTLPSSASALAPPQAGAVSVRPTDLGPGGAAPWILGAPERGALVRRLEATFPRLEETGCRVGIGVATGADAAFIAPFEALDVEPDRKLPLVKTRDVASGRVAWGGLGVVNPFAPEGGLVALEAYPRLAAHLEAHRARLEARHVARRLPGHWYRTIDRIHPALATTPKLLIPDIKGHAHVVLEEGRYYPHHNLYHITATTWDLRALRAVLASGIAHLFVAAYSPRLHGGFLRFQAQYLRRICLPRWESVPAPIQAALRALPPDAPPEAARPAVSALYGLDARDWQAIEGDAP
ncbi:Eco57I restriction-modification methylase domain-containing protein [Pararhodospirillum oryzae]|uniref:site-specific DNA-methyltransferase (adenine-specific) n=1 Tax=Pararhodospirillum oryzae TaxID=478448 RepID=A0A512H5I8_9PROT|nr:Eco57I restriction-modification methylase domain-containing protein [Pararhodospirillum oryzae]GEO80640.1 type II DNA modification methyltransferase [Pararhodospirillum oryzae]